MRADRSKRSLQSQPHRCSDAPMRAHAAACVPSWRAASRQSQRSMCPMCRSAFLVGAAASALAIVACGAMWCLMLRESRRSYQEFGGDVDMATAAARSDSENAELKVGAGVPVPTCSDGEGRSAQGDGALFGNAPCSMRHTTCDMQHATCTAQGEDTLEPDAFVALPVATDESEPVATDALELKRGPA